jgi:predicted tellurium resistance membrane protein TerC
MKTQGSGLYLIMRRVLITGLSSLINLFNALVVYGEQFIKALDFSLICRYGKTN